MQNKNEQQIDIDALVNRIDAFMENGGGHMNVKGGAGEIEEIHSTTCCGENTDTACKTPVH